jgi:cysteine desulfurase / selenocysteine lyase
LAVVDAVSAQQRPDAPLDVASIRRDFPILQEQVNGHPLVYLDNAATSQKPRQVIQALVDYYEHHNAPVHRSGHTLGVRASNLYEGTRTRLAHFLNAPDAAEIVFTRNTTEAINLVAYTWGAQHIGAGDEIVLTQMEHHSNLVPWQILAEARGAHLRFVPLTPTYKFDLAAYTQLLNPRVKLVALPHVSNVLGTITPVAEVARLAHEVGAVVLVDGAQSVPHMPVDLLEAMPPFLAGGSMIGEVQWTRSTWAPLPQKFEAGVPNTADVVALGAAIEYLDNLGMDRVRRHEVDLTRYALRTLRERHPELTLYGPNDLDVRAGVVAFNLKGGAVHPHDVAQLLDEQGIAVRAGHHCARPLHSVLGAPSSVRASFYVYNTEEEVDALARGLDVIKRVFRGVLERPEGGA